MRIKKWLLLPALLMALFASAITALAVKDAYCILGASAGEQAVFELDSHGVLVITGSGEMKPNQYYDYRERHVNKAIIEPGITGIGFEAFSRCTMRQISIPGTVTSIDSAAFVWCDNVEELVIPDSVTAIGWYAFRGMTNLKHMQLSASITRIEPYTFDSCESLATIVIPEGVTYIGHDAFANCTNLRAIVLPSTLQTIDEMAFYACTNLWHIFYTGTEEQWNQIQVSSKFNDAFLSVKPHFNCIGSELRELEVKEASCIAKGQTKLGCEVCGDAKVFATAKKPHVYQYACHGQCLTCGSTEGADHNWKDVITKLPTCKEEGIKTYSCRYCEESYEEAIEKESWHTYDNKCDNECNICGHTRDRSHKWDEGVVTKAPTCGEEGLLTRSCENCQETMVEAIPMLTDHTFDHDCDTTCNICGLSREISHVPGPPATTTSDQICTVCGTVLCPAIAETIPTAPPTEPTQPTEPAQPTEPTEPLPTSPVTAPTFPTEPQDQIDQAPSHFPAAMVVILIIGLTIALGIVLMLVFRKKR
jgi:hypothetical protein